MTRSIKHSNKIKKRKGSYVPFLFVTAFFLVSLLGVRLYQATPVNIQYIFSFSNDEIENKPATLEFPVQNSYIEDDGKQEVRIIGEQARFTIDPQYYDANSLSLSVPNSISNVKLEQLTIVSDDDFVVANYSSDKLSSMVEGDTVELTNKGDRLSISFSSDALNKINAKIHSNAESKKYLYIVLLIIYLLVMLRLSVLRKVKQADFAFLIAVSFFVLLFVFHLQSTDYAKTIPKTEDLYSQTEAIPIELPEKGIEQNFTLTAENVRSITIPMSHLASDTDENHLGAIYLYHGDELIVSDKIEKTDIIESKYDFSLESQKLKVGNTYRIKIVPFTTNSGWNVFGIEKNSKSSSITPEGNQALEFQLNVQPYNGKKIVYVILFGISLLIILALLVAKNYKASIVFSVIIYAVFLLFSVWRIDFYSTYVGRTPDETAHISYVSYLAENPEKIVPDFAEMKVGSKTESGYLVTRDASPTNYLGHPPLYYKILALAGGVEKKDDGMKLNYTRMHRLSILIGLTGLILCFYIGFTRIKTEPIYHVLFATLLTGPPTLLFGFSGITNDTLSFLTIAIAFLGLLRFSENKRNYLTYFLIALGITASVLTKVTSGLIIIIAAILVLIVTIVKEKNLKAIFNLEFLASMPIYFCALFYFLALFKETGSFQPLYSELNPAQFYQSGFYVDYAERSIKSLWEYVEFYFSRFFNTWTTFSSHSGVTAAKPDHWYAFSRIGMMLMLIVPISLFSFRKRLSEKVRVYNCMFIGIFITFLIQFKNAYTRFFIDGYLGSYQSRYYMCINVVLALATVLTLNKIGSVPVKGEEQIEGKSEFNFSLYLSIFMIFSVIYGDMIYTLLNYTNILNP